MKKHHAVIIVVAKLETLCAAARRHTPTCLRQRSGFRPWLEALESRQLLSTLTVSSASDSGSGSLRAEIAAAQSGDTIIFAGSLSGETITLTSGELEPAKNLTIQGLGAGQLTISGNSASRVFEVAPNITVTLSSMTIRYGDGIASASSSASWDGSGGGILNHGTLTASSCTVSNCIAAYSGGGICSDGSLAVSGCTVSSCAAAYVGGGIASDGTLTVSGCTISGDQVYEGTSGIGGGIWNSGTATLINSTLSNNRAIPNFTLYTPDNADGGGIYNQGTMELSGCTVSGNLGEYQGGGIFNDNTLTIQNSSKITGNTAYSSGGDVCNFDVLYLDSTSTIGDLYGNPAIQTPAGAFIFDASAQRIDYTFSGDVPAGITASNLTLVNTTTQQSILPASFNITGGGSIASFTFPGYASGLPDGNYQATLNGASAFNFTVLLGDANLDGVVDSNDFAILAAHYDMNSGATYSQGDFNYDGKVNALDFNALATNFGRNDGGPARNTSNGRRVESVANVSASDPIALQYQPDQRQ